MVQVQQKSVNPITGNGGTQTFCPTLEHVDRWICLQICNPDEIPAFRSRIVGEHSLSFVGVIEFLERPGPSPDRKAANHLERDGGDFPGDRPIRRRFPLTEPSVASYHGINQLLLILKLLVQETHPQSSPSLVGPARTM